MREREGFRGGERDGGRLLMDGVNVFVQEFLQCRNITTFNTLKPFAYTSNPLAALVK
jgi:hypothetical protein